MHLIRSVRTVCKLILISTGCECQNSLSVDESWASTKITVRCQKYTTKREKQWAPMLLLDCCTCMVENHLRWEFSWVCFVVREWKAFSYINCLTGKSYVWTPEVIYTIYNFWYPNITFLKIQVVLFVFKLLPLYFIDSSLKTKKTTYIFILRPNEVRGMERLAKRPSVCL